MQGIKISSSWYRIEFYSHLLRVQNERKDIPSIGRLTFNETILGHSVWYQEQKFESISRIRAKSARQLCYNTGMSLE